MLNINKTNNKNCNSTSVGCVEWDLAPIPCLDIKTGDTLDDVTFAIVRKLCDSENSFDLESLSLTELIERLNTTEPIERTIKTLFQFCIDNDVKIHKIVTQLRDSIPGATGGFNLDLKCFKKLDSYGNQLPYDEQTVLQDLINEACKIRDQYADMQDVISGMGDGEGGIYIEPVINEPCVFDQPTAPLRTSQYLARFASEYCTYKSKLGTIEQINIALGKQGGSETYDSGWITKFQADPNFIPFPTSLAQGSNNQWMAINNINNRLEQVEKCACKATCKDLTLGFGITDTDSGVLLEIGPQYVNS